MLLKAVADQHESEEVGVARAGLIKSAIYKDMNERKIQETIKMSSRARKGEGKKSQWPDYKIRRKKKIW